MGTTFSELQFWQRLLFGAKASQSSPGKINNSRRRHPHPALSRDSAGRPVIPQFRQRCVEKCVGGGGGGGCLGAMRAINRSDEAAATIVALPAVAAALPAFGAFDARKDTNPRQLLPNQAVAAWNFRASPS